MAFVTIFTKSTIDTGKGYLSHEYTSQYSDPKTGEPSPYVLIRDYKSGKNLVDPAKDLGLLMRGIWALIELNNPSASWFIKDRSISVASNYVVLEVINLAAENTNNFISSNDNSLLITSYNLTSFVYGRNSWILAR